MHKNILVTTLRYLLLLQFQYTVIQISNQVPGFGDFLKLSDHWDVYGLSMAVLEWHSWPLTVIGSFKNLWWWPLSSDIVKWPNADGLSVGVRTVKLSILSEFKLAYVIWAPHAMKKKKNYFSFTQRVVNNNICTREIPRAIRSLPQSKGLITQP